MKNLRWYIFIAALTAIVCAFVTVARGGTWLPPAPYATQYTLYFEVYDSNSPWRVYETAPAAADVHVFQDGASEARASNSVTDLGRTMSLVLTAAEMTARVVTVDINDATAVPLFGDAVFYIPTYGNASGYWTGNIDYLDNSVSDVNDIVTNIYDYSVEVNETYISNINSKSNATFNYITDVNTTLNEFYTYSQDVNETYITQIYNTTDANGTISIDANDLMNAEYADYKDTAGTLGWLWYHTLINLP